MNENAFVAGALHCLRHYLILQLRSVWREVRWWSVAETIYITVGVAAERPRCALSSELPVLTAAAGQQVLTCWFFSVKWSKRYLGASTSSLWSADSVAAAERTEDAEVIQSDRRSVWSRITLLCATADVLTGLPPVVVDTCTVGWSSHSTTPTSSRGSSRECRRVVQLATGMTSIARVTRKDLGASASALWNAALSVGVCTVKKVGYLSAVSLGYHSSVNQFVKVTRI